MQPQHRSSAAVAETIAIAACLDLPLDVAASAEAIAAHLLRLPGMLQPGRLHRPASVLASISLQRCRALSAPRQMRLGLHCRFGVHLPIDKQQQLFTRQMSFAVAHRLPPVRSRQPFERTSQRIRYRAQRDSQHLGNLAIPQSFGPQPQTGLIVLRATPASRDATAPARSRNSSTSSGPGAGSQVECSPSPSSAQTSSLHCMRRFNAWLCVTRKTQLRRFSRDRPFCKCRKSARNVS